MTATASSETAVPDEWHKTVCILCSANCGVELRVDGREITRVRGNKSHVASLGYTCEKALRLNHYQNGMKRLQSPMRREPDGSVHRRRLGHRHPRRRRRVSPRSGRAHGQRQGHVLRRRRAGQPPGWGVRLGHPAGPRHHRPLKRTRAREDRRGVGRGPPDRSPHPRRLPSCRGLHLPGQEPVAQPRLQRGPPSVEGHQQGSRADR